MKSILITGCNRGLGLGFVKYLVNSKNCDHLIATCRNPEQAKVKGKITKYLLSTGAIILTSLRLIQHPNISLI